jgi:hypothetical protein
MTELKNIELDLLFRIDFFALTNFGEDGFTDDEKFEEKKSDLKTAYGFSHYFQREFQGYEYVRLSDIEKETQPYIEYLKSLNEKEIFDCCQLEQAIGVFQNGSLKAFLSTDTGLCYNSLAHFNSLAEILNNGESDLGDINTFYGKVVGDSIELLYSPKSDNIDIDKTDGIISMSINRADFELEYKKLKNKVNEFFRDLKSKLKSEMMKPEKSDFVEEVFKEIKT